MDLNEIFKDRNKINGIPMTTVGDITNIMSGVYDDDDDYEEEDCKEFVKDMMHSLLGGINININIHIGK